MKVAPARETARRCEVLVVEDNADGRRSLCLLLGRAGFCVEGAADGCEGTDKGLALRPRAAVVDIGLPLLDGYGVARQLRAALGQDVLLIAHSAYAPDAGDAGADPALFDVWLRKPADPGELLGLLRGAV